MKRLRRILWAILAMWGGQWSVAIGSGITGTPHDLSASGGSACRYCHTQHRIVASKPLWNHELSTAVYRIYQSTSLDADVGQPTGASKLCLSCHDGTVALSATIQGGTNEGVPTYIQPGTKNLGTDLSDDHPVSFAYSGSLASRDPQLRPPQLLPPELQLDQYSELQCTTCHDPHDNQFGDFLVMDNQGSQMCVSCHDLTGWATAIHQTASAVVADADDPYLQMSAYTTMTSAACLNCHRPHSAGGRQRLLHFASSAENCLNCHNGSMAIDMRASLGKRSSHDVRRYEGIHDIRESPMLAPRHVDCSDCHNPHEAREGQAAAPAVPGALRGVSGVTIAGDIATAASFEYEVCFKCHGDAPSRVTSPITRQITQTNTRLEFDPANPSFHPVAGPGGNMDVPSLLPGFTPASRIGCTDCHNSDDPASGRGPHGSRHPALLAYRYETADNTPESDSAYELCYQCHSRNSILANESFPEHDKHLNEQTPCSACHDPHGISNAQGNIRNNSHLINFDISIVNADTETGRLEFEDEGTFRGRCFLTCHGVKHSPESY